MARKPRFEEVILDARTQEVRIVPADRPNHEHDWQPRNATRVHERRAERKSWRQRLRMGEWS